MSERSDARKAYQEVWGPSRAQVNHAARLVAERHGVIVALSALFAVIDDLAEEVDGGPGAARVLYEGYLEGMRSQQ